MSCRCGHGPTSSRRRQRDACAAPAHTPSASGRRLSSCRTTTTRSTGRPSRSWRSTTPYKGDYRDAFVLDLGAHKGYYGAYAFRHGARTVVSYEPESTNASYLEAAAARLPRRTYLADGEGRRRRGAGRGRSPRDGRLLGACDAPAGRVGRARGGPSSTFGSTRSRTSSRRRPRARPGRARSSRSTSRGRSARRSSGRRLGLAGRGGGLRRDASLGTCGADELARHLGRTAPRAGGELARGRRCGRPEPERQPQRLGAAVTRSASSPT